MRIEILDEAESDLIDGFAFYERQSKGLGDYFLDSVFADIESLHLHAGIHALHFGYYRLFAKHFSFFVDGLLCQTRPQTISVGGFQFR